MLGWTQKANGNFARLVMLSCFSKAEVIAAISYYPIKLKP